MKKLLVPSLLSLTLVSISVAHADWPQFNGPAGNGVSSEKGLARSWPKRGPKTVWETKLGEGFGGASIEGDEVYVLDRVDDAEDVLRCLDFSTGKQLWELRFKAPGRLSYNGSRTVPSIGKERIFAVSPLGGIYCVDRKTHKLVWRKSLVSDLGGRLPNWGASQSPLLYKSFVILAPGADSNGIVALDGATGEIVWRAAGVGGGGHSTPRLVTLNGTLQVLFISGSKVTAVAPDSGKEIWSFPFRNRNPIPFPTVVGDDRLFITAGYRAGSVMIKVNKDGSAKELWRIREGSQIHPALYYKGHLYVNLNENSNLKRSPIGLACLDLDGKRLWSTEREPDIERGSLILADDMILMLGGQDGVLHLVSPTPDGYKEIASARVFSDLKRRGNNIWAPMALSRGKLIVRTSVGGKTQMKCLDLSAAGTKEAAVPDDKPDVKPEKKPKKKFF